MKYKFRLSGALIRALAACILLLSLTAVGLSQTAPRYLRYIDPAGGMTADQAVALAIEKNTELDAMRREVEAGEALIRQAGARPNPSLTIRGDKMTDGPNYGLMVEGGLPLELGGRRGARILVAERELEIRRLAVAEQERRLAAQVRRKYGEASAAGLRLRFIEEMLTAAEENYALVSAQVDEGRRAPLERNMETVELNRIRALLETADGGTAIQLIELRNLIGIPPEEPLRIRGDLDTPEVIPSDRLALVAGALASRTDLAGARAVERLAAARTEQARTVGRVDADVMLGFQRMRSGFPMRAFDGAGMLMPISMRSNAFTFGVKLSIPVFNRNRDAVEAALLEEQAARQRREFGELTIRHEVAAALIRYESALRAKEIYRVGVRAQAADNRDVVRQTYELGSTTLLDYIAELRRFIDTESGYIDARLAAYLAYIDLLEAVNSPELVTK